MGFSSLTNAGRSLIASAMNNDKVVLTEGAVGDSTTIPTSSNVALGNELWRGNISGYSVDGTVIKVKFTIPANAFNGAVTIREVGIYGHKEGVGSPTLIAIAQYPESYVPSFIEEGSSKSFVISVHFMVTNGLADNLRAVIDPNVANTTASDLEAYYTKSEMDVMLADRDDTVYNLNQDVYTKTEVDGKVDDVEDLIVSENVYDYHVKVGDFWDLKTALESTEYKSVYIPSGTYSITEDNAATIATVSNNNAVINITTGKRIVGEYAYMNSTNFGGVVIDCTLLGSINSFGTTHFIKSYSDDPNGTVHISNVNICNWSNNEVNKDIVAVGGTSITINSLILDNVNVLNIQAYDDNSESIAFYYVGEANNLICKNVDIGINHGKKISKIYMSEIRIYGARDVILGDNFSFYDCTMGDEFMRQCYEISNVVIDTGDCAYVLDQCRNVSNIEVKSINSTSIIHDSREINSIMLNSCTSSNILNQSDNVSNIKSISCTSSSSAFYNSSNISNIELDTSATWVFDICDNVDNVTISDASDISSGIFSECTNVSNISLGSLSSTVCMDVNDFTFYNSSNISNVEVINSIGRVFYGCSNVSNFKIISPYSDNSLSSSGSYVISGGSNFKDGIILNSDNGGDELAAAFYNVSNISNIEIGSSSTNTKILVGILGVTGDSHGAVNCTIYNVGASAVRSVDEVTNVRSILDDGSTIVELVKDGIFKLCNRVSGCSSLRTVEDNRPGFETCLGLSICYSEKMVATETHFVGCNYVVGCSTDSTGAGNFSPAVSDGAANIA